MTEWAVVLGGASSSFKLSLDSHDIYVPDITLYIAPPVALALVWELERTSRSARFTYANARIVIQFDAWIYAMAYIATP